MVTQGNINSSKSTQKYSVHSPVFIKPHYSRQKTCLHRYLDSRFMERFNQEINFSQDPEQYLAWISEDHMSPYKDQLTLRQPVHRTFYMVSSAIACQKPGLPAFNADKIISAGFVIRKKLNIKNTFQDENPYAIWNISNGEPSGWIPGSPDPSEPDICRRLLQKKIIQPQSPEPPYSGEEIHPMQIRQITLEDGTRQTIIYGYLPIGGSYTPAVDTTTDQKVRSSDSPLRKLLPWPKLGLMQPSSKLSEAIKVKTHLSQSAFTEAVFSEQWHTNDGLLVDRGISTWRFAKLLKQAIYTYHIGDSDFNLQNQALLNKFHSLKFFNPDKPPEIITLKKLSVQNNSTELSLADYLIEIFAQENSPVLVWLEDFNKPDNRSFDNNDPVGPLPNINNEEFTLSLQINKEDAEEINYLFDQHMQQQLLKTQLDLPLPKFEQSENDQYYVQPFIRILENCQECIYWGQPGQEFRVAAPFDPQASRPNMIQLPDIEDVRRGIAQGVSFIAPPKLAQTLRQLDPSKGLSPDIQGNDPGPQLGIGWILSFSLPVITLCAMILLMIVISILNFIFYWIPWVISWIPYPKFNSGS